jgi:hypothetical protein
MGKVHIYFPNLKMRACCMKLICSEKKKKQSHMNQSSEISRGYFKHCPNQAKQNAQELAVKPTGGRF